MFAIYYLTFCSHQNPDYTNYLIRNRLQNRKMRKKTKTKLLIEITDCFLSRLFSTLPFSRMSPLGIHMTCGSYQLLVQISVSDGIINRDLKVVQSVEQVFFSFPFQLWKGQFDEQNLVYHECSIDYKISNCWQEKSGYSWLLYIEHTINRLAHYTGNATKDSDEYEFM